jgi:hypothetical protein
MPNDYDRDVADRSWVWWILAVVAILVLLFFIVPALIGESAAGLAERGADTVEQGVADLDGTGGADPTPSIADILGNPIALEGNSVTVTGEVERRGGDRVFVLDEFGDAQDHLLVITLDDQLPFTEGAHVSVAGIVRRGTAADVEREFDVALDPASEAEIDNRPVIVASAVTAEP